MLQGGGGGQPSKLTGSSVSSAPCYKHESRRAGWQTSARARTFPAVLLWRLHFAGGGIAKRGAPIGLRSLLHIERFSEQRFRSLSVALLQPQRRQVCQQSGVLLLLLCHGTNMQLR